MLPPDLAAAVATALHGVPAKALAQSADAVSAHYRGSDRRGGRAIRSDTDVLAYLAYRMPATYAAVAVALAATANRRPEWWPRTVLDVGSGPGTAMWAAAELWPSVETFVLVESDARMIATGKRLAQLSSHPAVRNARWETADMTSRPELPSSDVVIAAYSLGELSPARLEEVVAWLWSVCGDTAVIVEPGTPRGFDTVHACRDLFRAQGAWILAPCPHQEACPMAGGQWCHFSERLERSRVHRAAKGAALGYEDEKYSYVSVSRAPGLPIEARVIGHPRTGHGGIELNLCTADGLRSATVQRRDGELYRIAKRARWGAAIPQLRAEPDHHGEEPAR